jgi:hypothetical protein
MHLADETLIGPISNFMYPIHNERFYPHKTLMNKPARSCNNCGTNKTSVWRRDAEKKTLCNACGLHLRNRGTHRQPKRRQTMPAVFAPFQARGDMMLPMSSHSITAANTVQRSRSLGDCNESYQLGEVVVMQMNTMMQPLFGQIRQMTPMHVRVNWLVLQAQSFHKTSDFTLTDFAFACTDNLMHGADKIIGRTGVVIPIGWFDAQMQQYQQQQQKMFEMSVESQLIMQQYAPLQMSADVSEGMTLSPEPSVSIMEQRPMEPTPTHINTNVPQQPIKTQSPSLEESLKLEMSMLVNSNKEPLPFMGEQLISPMTSFENLFHSGAANGLY